MFVCFVIFVCALSGPLVTAHHVMTGQPHEVPVNSTDVLRAARFAVVEFNRANAAEEQFTYTIVNITSAKIQVKLNSLCHGQCSLNVINILPVMTPAVSCRWSKG